MHTQVGACKATLVHSSLYPMGSVAQTECWGWGGWGPCFSCYCHSPGTVSTGLGFSLDLRMPQMAERSLKPAMNARSTASPLAAATGVSTLGPPGAAGGAGHWGAARGRGRNEEHRLRSQLSHVSWYLPASPTFSARGIPLGSSLGTEAPKHPNLLPVTSQTPPTQTLDVMPPGDPFHGT